MLEVIFVPKPDSAVVMLPWQVVGRMLARSSDRAKHDIGNIGAIVMKTAGTCKHENSDGHWD